MRHHDFFSVGLIGTAIEASPSPAMHNALYASIRAPFVYLPLQCQFRDWRLLPRLAQLIDLVGCNITAPFKRLAYQLAQRCDDWSQRSGAVNTLVRRRNVWIGYNTDAMGFQLALQRAWRLDLHGQRIALFGAGGTAATLASVALTCGCDRLTIFNRHRYHAAKLRQHLRRSFPRHADRISIATLSAKEVRLHAHDIDLLLQTTSAPLCGPTKLKWIDADYPTHLTVFDVRYYPDNRWLQDAHSAGARTANGLEMLIAQAAASAELWLDRSVNRSVMRHTAHVFFHRND